MSTWKNLACLHGGSLLLLLTLPGAASARDRTAVMEDAVRYAEHAWQMKPENQKAACKADYKSDHAPGPRVGLPYAWGGWMSVAEFDRRIASGEAAGSHSRDGILSCVAGVDCSGFVSQVWQLPKRHTTSSISAVTRPISLDELAPGDALNKAGSHIVLYAGASPDGKPIIYEASGSASRVRMATPSWSYLAGYQPIRYTGLQEPAVAASQEKAPPSSPAASAPPSPAAPQSAPATPQAPSASSPPPAPTAAVGTSTAAPASAPPAGVARVDAPAPATPASRSTRVTLRYGTDVGFTPGGEDAQAIGPDYLVAGPNGTAALYDRVRRQVLLLSRDSTRKTLAVENADGLAFTREGNLAVLDGASHRILLFRATGEPLRTLDLRSSGFFRKGMLTLEESVLYATDSQGQRQAIAELAGGRFKPIRPGKELEAGQVLKWKERGSQSGLIEVGGETLQVPPSVHVAARRFGPWIELTASSADRQGRLSVKRTLRRPKRVLSLPTADQGAYAPIADLAVQPGGDTVVYLEPAEEAVSVVWVDTQ
ncbi:MAG: hypothetical protein JXB05_36250 [Myxococcaceae bacterium]|nr:hypothetical protein [Myxococcaceae bacterium]